MKNNIELLSPAGNKDSFMSAINAGADAIYMGLDRFNARTMAKNFNLDEYIESIKYAHMIGVKVYLTLIMTQIKYYFVYLMVMVETLYLIFYKKILLNI